MGGPPVEAHVAPGVLVRAAGALVVAVAVAIRVARIARHIAKGSRAAIVLETLVVNVLVRRKLGQLGEVRQKAGVAGALNGARDLALATRREAYKAQTSQRG